MSTVRILALVALLQIASAGCQSDGPTPAPEPQAPPEPTSAGLRSDHPPPPPPRTNTAADATASAPPNVRASGLDNPRALRSDILLVNDMSLSVNEILFALRNELDQRPEQLTQAAANALAEKIAGQVQFEVGSMLLYQEAAKNLNDQQQTALEATAQRAFDAEVTRRHGGSVARFEKQLSSYGMTLAMYRERLQRQLLVRSYTRDKIRPEVGLRRSELLAYYRDNKEKFSEPETRELLMIEAPYQAFMPDGVRWETAGRSAQNKAKLAARRHIRKAHEALIGRDFRAVAREYSKSSRAGEGGSWGTLGAPLQPPFTELSEWAFTHSPNQASQPVELNDGWYIAACGQINARRTYSFADSQEKIRDEIVNERADLLAGEYVRRLARQATISDLGSFIRQAIERALA